MKKQLRALVSRWLCLAFGLKAVTTGDAATDLPTPTLSQTPIAAVASALATQELPTVRTANGILSGKMENGVAVFKGIPFAAPPVGRLRWREPHQATSWDGVRKADENGNSCVQPKGPGLEMRGLGALSEDCLYLNVWTAAIDPAAKQPVVVWIHGGALTVGAGSLDLYNGSPLAKKGAVAVNSPPLL